jgi:DNA-binding MarR family transcriptional regulator
MKPNYRLSFSHFGDYSDPPPVLIAASSPDAQVRAVTNAEAAGFRTATVSVEGASDRLGRQAAASAFWLELDSDAGPELDRLLERVEAEAASGRFAAVISATSTLVDPIVARIHDPEIQLIFDASSVDRATALAVATSWSSLKAEDRLHDITHEPSTARLRQLSDEVGRIAATLARLSAGPEASQQAVAKPVEKGSDAPVVSIETVRQVIRARRLRTRYFDEELFADPAWDMLLDLLQAELAQHRVPVSSLCIAAAVPPTTALRWIKTMTDAGLFKRRADPHDGRRVFIELSQAASSALRRYFGETGATQAI